MTWYKPRRPGQWQATQEDHSKTPIQRYFAKMSAPLLQLCHFALKKQKDREFPCREYLKQLHMEASNIEELIDSYGAQKNENWFPFREAVAAEKLFSSVYYNMLHIQRFSTFYKLLDIDDDFSSATADVFKLLKKAIVTGCESMLQQAQRCNIVNQTAQDGFVKCSEEAPNFRLAADRDVRHVKKIGETVVYLSTQFLNLSEDRDVKGILKQREYCDYHSCIPDLVNEESLRLVESRFHNLQSLYDTYIFESDMESQNRNLPYLRGHISIIFHLFEIATDIVHYYIRHMSGLRRDTYADLKYPLEVEEILSILYDYLFHYAREYMESTVHLCRAMIKSYSTQEEIALSIPNYRGFHVRPSTLISKIVNHYGSTVTASINGEEYNAGITLDLFRANESINAVKRRYISEILSKRTDLHQPIPEDNQERIEKLQRLFLELIHNNEIILYDSNLPFDDLKPQPDETLLDLAGRYIKHFMSIAKMDVKSDLKVVFRGDNRALKDIALLAEHGYGEDKFGNNIVLPEELTYLRR